MGAKLNNNRLLLHLIKRVLLSILLLLGIFMGSCSLLPIPPIPETGTGTMLVQHGKYLYRIGGFGSDGNVQNTVYMAATTINPDGEIAISPWAAALPLPEGRAFGAAFSIGQYLYVIGGENNDGPVDTLYIAKIDPLDGTLGFHHIYGGADYWVDHT
ncbi:MAG: hypothetical protein HQ557_19830, partial [Bacteroidetes bacterium]|nr:hypothetical protein [Bacteroidota bacterium]